LSQILPLLLDKGLVQLLTPKPVPDPVPPYWNMSAYCAFHQGPGHVTDEIKQNGILKHKIQDLIDKIKMTVPQEDAPSNPNKNVGIFKDPLPQHGSVASTTPDASSPP
jgi:hypothetical protein